MIDTYQTGRSEDSSQDFSSKLDCLFCTMRNFSSIRISILVFVIRLPVCKKNSEKTRGKKVQEGARS